jgi:spoIIIJ-associated protein
MGPDLIRDGKLDRQAAGETLRKFLEEIVRVSGLDLKVKVQVVDTPATDVSGGAEVIADLDGRDKEILLERNGEVLKAFEHLAFRALRLEPTFHEKIHLDSGGYRALPPNAYRARINRFDSIRCRHASGASCIWR